MVPAPVLGIDARTILAGGDPLHCIYAFNLLPNEYGLRVRPGYREWAIELENVSGGGVTTIIPFGGADDDASNDRLFAVTNEGIWNVTENEAVPTLVLDFSVAPNGGDTSSNAGRGVYSYFTSDAGEEILYYADSINGLFQYRESTDMWERVSDITGPVVEDVNFVMTHKDQLWLIERDSTSAWYLPQGNIAGGATEFVFGSKFKHGANLAGLFSWTIDGGSGVDDYLVAVSRAGDVLLYQGTDPGDADKWSQQGQWFIGALPKGSRFGTQEGGDLQLLSIYGLTSMDETVRGVDGKNVNAQTEAAKIAIIIRNAMEKLRNDDGWQVSYIPALGQVLINSPLQTNSRYIQYARSTTVNGWGIWRDVPMLSFDEWNGKLYFGTEDNRVMVMDTLLDDVKITPPAMEENGSPVRFSILTTFQDYGEPAQFKRAKYARPQFVSQDAPSYTVKFRYDYDIAEAQDTSILADPTVAFWDVSTWDVALWGTDIPTGFNSVRGGWGLGRYIAIAMAGQTRAETTLINWDVVWDTGAPL